MVRVLKINNNPFVKLLYGGDICRSSIHSSSSLTQITSEELVNSCIERIKDVNKYLNCIVDERYDEALEEAKRADKLISSAMVSVDELKQHKPFLGVPFTSKESTHAAGESFVLTFQNSN